MMQRSRLIAGLATLVLLVSNQARATALNVYGLAQTGSADALITYDLTQKIGGKLAAGYEPSSLVRLDSTTLQPENDITSIAISETSLYGLVKTGSVDSLITYDLTQKTGGKLAAGYEPSSLVRLDSTTLQPENDITSIAISGTSLYGLVKTGSVDSLITYDLTQKTGGKLGAGYEPSTLVRLDSTTLQPENDITSIAVNSASNGPNGGEVPVPEPTSTAALMLVMLTVAGLLRLLNLQTLRASAAPRLSDHGALS